MKKIIPFLLAFISLTSCSDFLDESPRDQIDESQVYTSSSQLYLNTVATLYNYIGGYSQSQGLQGTYRGVYDLETFTTDEAMIPTRGGDWYDGGYWQSLFLHTWTANDESLTDTWNYLYKVIVLSNRSLEKLQQYTLLATPQELLAWQAEVRAVRALYYYYLLDLFARVPIVTSSTVPLSAVQQSRRSEVFRYVTDELQEVLPLLPLKASQQLGEYYGRLTRPVAFFLLSKLALNAEVYADDDWTDTVSLSGDKIFFKVGESHLNAWQTCWAYADSLEACGYELAQHFADNFAVYNETSSENIFTIPMDPASYTNQMQNLFRSYHYGHASAYGFTAENGSSATLEALETFSYGTDQQDARFAQTYYADRVTDLNGQPIVLQNGDTLQYYPLDVQLVLTGHPHQATAGARMKKYAVDPTATKDGKLMNNDIVLFRYADVLLMKSEAKVRSGESGDVELNLVRQRAGMEPLAATLSTLLRERQLELAWEGWRRQDLVRFGQYTRAYSDRPQLTDETNGYTTVFPIPQNLVAPTGAFTQNPGY